MVDQFCDSYRRAPSSITLDIDDTFDVVHGHQQLSLFNAHYDERCFLPIHIYEAASGKPVAMILREGKTPSGKEVRTVLKHVIRRIRRHWPKVHILVRGDSHYGRDEVMEWCEETTGIDYVFGFAGNEVLHALTREAADAIAVQRALSGKDKCARLQGLSLRRQELGQGAPLRGAHRGNAPRAWTSAMSSPRSRPAPGIFTRRSIARGAMPRTSSSCTRASSPPIAPHAASPKPTSSA